MGSFDDKSSNDEANEETIGTMRTKTASHLYLLVSAYFLCELSQTHTRVKIVSVCVFWSMLCELSRGMCLLCSHKVHCSSQKIHQRCCFSKQTASLVAHRKQCSAALADLLNSDVGAL